MRNKNKEIEEEIEKRKQQLEEIERKMEQVKRQAEKDTGKPPQDRDTRDYPTEAGRKPKTKLRNQMKNLNCHHPLGKVHPQVHQ